MTEQTSEPTRPETKPQTAEEFKAAVEGFLLERKKTLAAQFERLKSTGASDDLAARRWKFAMESGSVRGTVAGDPTKAVARPVVFCLATLVDDSDELDGIVVYRVSAPDWAACFKRARRLNVGRLLVVPR